MTTTRTIIAAILTALLTAPVVAQQPEKGRSATSQEQPTATIDETSESQKSDSLSIVEIATIVIALTGVFALLFSIYKWIHRDKTKLISSKMKKLLKEAEKSKTELDAVTEESKRVLGKLKTMTAEIAAQYPEKVDMAVYASMGIDDTIDRAIEETIFLQTDNQYDNARKKWLAIADQTKGKNDEIAALAYFSAAWLIQAHDDKYKVNDEKILNDIISLYGQVLRIEPDNAKALYNRGITKSGLNDFTGAIEDYDQALKIKPDFAKAFYTRGNAKLKLGNHKDAIKDYDQVLKN